MLRNTAGKSSGERTPKPSRCRPKVRAAASAATSLALRAAGLISLMVGPPPKSRKAREIRQKLLENLEALPDQIDSENLRSGDIAPRPGQAGGETGGDHVTAAT